MLQLKVTDWLNGYKTKTHKCCLQETHFRPKDSMYMDLFFFFFCMHSTSLCLLVGAFNPFTFKVIIDIYVLIAIFLIVLG